MDKIVSLREACSLVNDGEIIAIGGNVLHRVPMAFTREVIRQKKKNLRIVKTAGGLEIDMLCLAGCVHSVDAGIVSYETQYAMAKNYRSAIAKGDVISNDHADYTVVSALRAASMGTPFMPVMDLQGTETQNVNDRFKKVQDPFTKEWVTVVKALQPDVSVIHVHEADRNGNGVIRGPLYDDVLLSRAGKKVILTTERIVPETKFTRGEEEASIPYFLVDAVVPVKQGAYPCDCLPLYGIDKASIERFNNITTRDQLINYIEEYTGIDY